MSQDEQLHKIRHSMAHVMAEAVIEKFPGTKVAIGPSIEDGFYYDFDLPRQLNEEDLEAISERMQEIIKEGHEFQRSVVKRDEAYELFKKQDQDYKLELLEAIPGGRGVPV